MKKWFVALSMFISTFVACDNSYEKELNAEKEKQKTETDAKELYNRTVDSVLKSDGFYDFDKQSERELGELYVKRDSLQALPCRADVLDKRIRKSAQPIIIQSITNMANELKPYNLGVSTERLISKVSPYVNEYGAFESDTTYVLYYDELDFIVETFCSAINLDYSDKYDVDTKAKIRNTVRKHAKYLLANLKRNRIAISKEYSAYYPVLDLSNVPQQFAQFFNYDPAVNYQCNDIYWYDRGALGDGLYVVKIVDVYDQNLDKSFFNDAKAKYRLVQVAKGKWQVKKTLENGKVEKTNVFEDDVDYCFDAGTTVPEDIENGSVEFKAVEGANVGVRIFYKQYIYVKRASKSDIISKNPTKDMKDLKMLNYQIIDKARKQESVERAMRAKADSIANVRVAQFRRARSSL